MKNPQEAVRHAIELMTLHGEPADLMGGRRTLQDLDDLRAKVARMEEDGDPNHSMGLEHLDELRDGLVKVLEWHDQPTVTILNFTQHMATPAQVAAGVVEPTDKETIRSLLTFHRMPALGGTMVAGKADVLTTLAEYEREDEGRWLRPTHVMIGGAPYLMGPLTRKLKRSGFGVLFSFSERVSVESVNADGAVEKVTKFQHRGWVHG